MVSSLNKLNNRNGFLKKIVLSQKWLILMVMGRDKGTWKTDPEFGNTTRFDFLVERGFLPERKMSL